MKYLFTLSENTQYNNIVYKLFEEDDIKEEKNKEISRWSKSIKWIKNHKSTISLTIGSIASLGILIGVINKYMKIKQKVENETIDSLNSIANFVNKHSNNNNISKAKSDKVLTFIEGLKPDEEENFIERLKKLNIPKDFWHGDLGQGYKGLRNTITIDQLNYLYNFKLDGPDGYDKITGFDKINEKYLKLDPNNAEEKIYINKARLAFHKAAIHGQHLNNWMSDLAQVGGSLEMDTPKPLFWQVGKKYDSSWLVAILINNGVEKVNKRIAETQDILDDKIDTYKNIKKLTKLENAEKKRISKLNNDFQILSDKWREIYRNVTERGARFGTTPVFGKSPRKEKIEELIQMYHDLEKIMDQFTNK